MSHSQHSAHAARPPLADGASGGRAANGDHGEHHDTQDSSSMAVSATLHCLTGCAIGEIIGLMIGTAIGLSVGWTIALAVGLAFLFGYALSILPLLKAGVGVSAALGVVLAADTLSIATMELVDNAVMAAFPGAMEAGLVNPVFWLGLMVALTAAFFAAYPVNRHLLRRGKGHALIHRIHGAADEVSGARRFIPTLATPTLVAAVVAFLLGGLVVSVADAVSGNKPSSGGHAAPPVAVR